MSSSADFSDEDDYSVKSGSASPAPGDTLPWNLPRHERSKRKIHGGSVLDPAERAVLRIAGEQQSPCCPRQKQSANMVRLRSIRGLDELIATCKGSLCPFNFYFGSFTGCSAVDLWCM